MFKHIYQGSSYRITLRWISIGCLLMHLTGCAIFKSDFSCDRVGGANRCVSMDQIYSEVQHGEITADKNPYDGKQKAKKSATKQNNASLPHINSTASEYRVSIPEAGEPVRFAENIQKIWIFPFEDKQGNYHETAIVYAVLTPSHWIGQPVSSIQALGENA